MRLKRELSYRLALTLIISFTLRDVQCLQLQKLILWLI